MRAAALILPCLLAASAASAQDPVLARVRADFPGATADAAATGELATFIEARFPGEPAGWPPVAQAYYAACEGLRGKHDPNPLMKLLHVRAAVAVIRDLAEAHPRDLEIRFLRFVFFEQVPAIFGVSGYVPGDCAVLVDALAGADESLPPDLRRDMVRYMLSTDALSDEQRKRLGEVPPS
jgi:hypothetical protein